MTQNPKSPGSPLPSLPGYQILGVLGQGGMGIVYRARQTALDRLVALKMVKVRDDADGTAFARFQKEAVSVGRLQHPNIVAAHDFGRHDDQVYFVMELLDGETLEAWLARSGALDEQRVWGLLRQAAAGLAHAAAQGLIHRDLKPANLMLVKPPEGITLPGDLPLLKITDFGLVSLINEDRSNRLTAAGAVVGTPVYMAPEQFKGAALDVRTDIYALGVTALHMLSGDTPWRGQSVWQIMEDKVNGAGPSVPKQIAPPSADLLRDMIARQPEQRINNYVDLLQRMDAVTGTNTPHMLAQLDGADAGPTTVLAPGERSRARRRPWRPIATGLLVVTMLAAAYWRGVFSSGPSADDIAVSKLNFVATARTAALFDGKSIDGWQIQGSWFTANDSEGGAVLAGNGSARRPLPDWQNFRVTVGMDPQSAQAVELHFGISASGRRFVLRVAEQDVVVGEQDSDAAEFRPIAASVAHRKPRPEASPYREIRLERQGQYWLAYFQGQRVGVAKVGDREAPELRLLTRGGTAHFEGLFITELAPG